MAEHAHTTPATARRRRVRAAPGALDRRAASSAETTIRIQLSRPEGDGLPLVIDWQDGYATLLGHPALPLTFDWTGVITPNLRNRIERDVDLLIALLDALDAAGQDLEEDNEDCCDAADDDPASSHPVMRGAGSAWGPGDPTDGESTPEDEGEPTDDDLPQKWQPPATAILSQTRCCNGPFQLDSATYAAVRGYAAPMGRPA